MTANDYRLGEELANQGWDLIRDVTEELVRDFRITERFFRRTGEPHGFLMAWAYISEQLVTDLDRIMRSMEGGRSTPEEAVDHARQLVLTTVGRLRPEAHLHRRIRRLERLAPEVEIAQYLVASERLATGLLDLLDQIAEGVRVPALPAIHVIVENDQDEPTFDQAVNGHIGVNGRSNPGR